MAPRVWLLLGERAGEIAQQRVLAHALGLPVIEKRLDDPSTQLHAPWPDLLISFGNRLAAAVKIKRDSGGRTRLVHLGRPRGVATDFIDLIVPMPQDRVPWALNVTSLRMPLTRFDSARLAADAQRLEARLQQHPRPWTALLVGGPSRHFDFNVDLARALGQQASAHARRQGGSLLVTTSPRTPADCTAALRAAIDVPNAFYEFHAPDPENPLGGYLGAADAIVVTGDTSSMLGEAWRTGKPVYVAPLPAKRDLRRRLIRVGQTLLPPALELSLQRRGLISARVDLRGWLEDLQHAGYIAWLGDAAPTRSYTPEIDTDLSRVVARIRSLLV